MTSGCARHRNSYSTGVPVSPEVHGRDWWSWVPGEDYAKGDVSDFLLDADVFTRWALT